MRNTLSKIKTRKSIIKRFKLTSTGKLLYKHAHNQHLMLSKSANQRSRLKRRKTATNRNFYKLYGRTRPKGLTIGPYGKGMNNWITQVLKNA